MLRLLWFCLLSAFICACKPADPPQGIVASVNGEPIALHLVEALMDSRSAALGIPPAPTVAQMRERYGHALATLIVQALVRQELAESGMPVTEAEVEAAIAAIQKDYAEGSLEVFLTEASLREDEWRLLMRDHLAIEKFSRQVLEPSIRINLAEMREYYKNHAQDFTAPETWHICLKTAASKEEAEAFCEHVSPASASDPTTQCGAALEADVPDPWRQELKKGKLPRCGKIIKNGDNWQVAAALEKFPPRQRRLSDVYGLAENILLEKKKAAAFNDWLNGRLARAQILVSPEIFPQSGKERKQDGPAKTGGASW